MKKSPRQAKFILEYLTDLNATKAAERAGYKHPNVQGSQLLSNPIIKDEIDREIKGRSERLRRDSDWVMERLEAEASNLNNTPSARIRALELIGKHVGAFKPEKVEVTYPSTFLADL
jgi:phage terminase small subunit